MAEELQLGLGRRQIGLADPALRLEQRGQVRVIVECDAVGTRRYHPRQRHVEAHERLLRQSVDEVDVDRFEPRAARSLDQLQRALLVLQSVDRRLDRRIEVLHPEARAIEPHLTQCMDHLDVHGARIDFDRILAMRGEREVFREPGEQPGQRGRIVVGRRAAAPVHLGHVRIFLEQFRLQLDLPAEVVKVKRRLTRVPRHDLVAGAVEADVAAERKVHVKREWPLYSPHIAARGPGPVGLVPECLDEAVGGRIGRVTWPLTVEAAHQFDVEFDRHSHGLPGPGSPHCSVVATAPVLHGGHGWL